MDDPPPARTPAAPSVPAARPGRQRCTAPHPALAFGLALATALAVALAAYFLWPR